LGLGVGGRGWGRALAASAFALVDGGAVVDLDAGFVVGGGGDGAHAVLDLRRHGHEGLLHVGGVLGRRLQERDAQLVRVLFGCGEIHHFLGGQVALVAHQQFVDVLAGVSVNLLQPLLHVVEGFLVGDVVDHDDAVSPAVVAGGDGAEPLLPRRVPNLKLDSFPIEFNCPDFKVYSNGTDVALCVGVISKSEQQAGFSYT